jgi:hypothetical protein
MKRIALAAAIALTTLSSAHADGERCNSRMVVNIADNMPMASKVEAKVMAKIRKDLKEVLGSVNDTDRDSKIEDFINKVSAVTAEVMNHKSNEDIDGAVAMSVKTATNTIAYIEKNAKNPTSGNIAASKKGQITMAVSMVVHYHVACAE